MVLEEKWVEAALRIGQLGEVAVARAALWAARLRQPAQVVPAHRAGDRLGRARSAVDRVSRRLVRDWRRQKNWHIFPVDHGVVRPGRTRFPPDVTIPPTRAMRAHVSDRLAGASA